MRDGKPLYGDTFNRHLKSVCMTLGIVYRSSHQIRFIVATLLYEAGVPLNEISRMLGHSDISSTQVYSHLVNSKIKDVYARSHPRA